MKLIDRFIEMSDWDTSRKAAVLNAVGLTSVLMMLAFLPSEREWPNIDRPLLVTIFGGYAAAFAFCLLASLVSIRHGMKGSWMGTLTTCLTGPFMLALVYGLGIWTSPFFSLYLISVIGMALWFRERAGWFSLLGGLPVFAVLGYLELEGVLPDAPIILHTDKPMSAFGALGRMVPILVFFVVIFAMCMAMVRARHLQDQRLREAHKLIRRYVPSQLADKILAGGHAEERKHERRNLTIFFSDVAGFTDASDELDPEQLASLLNEYLGEMTQIADRHGATINQFVGDGIMIFFGAPQATNDRDHALRAVRMALDMQARMRELQDVWFKRGFERPFKVRIGLNTGYASVGDFGSQGRVMYSAIGLQTNLAARIQARCEPGGILISHSTWALVNGDFTCNPQGEIEVKGVHYPVRVYDVTGPKVVALPVMAAAG